MSNNDENAAILDLTARGVEFAEWQTGVENDDLVLARVNFDLGSPLFTLVQEGLTFALPPDGSQRRHLLEATFISVDKRAIVRFGFPDVIAFRVLDEGGLLELWAASSANPRPARSTFRARGHQWASESPLTFLAEGDLPRFSYFVVTDTDCLEVVCINEPSVREIGPALVTRA